MRLKICKSEPYYYISLEGNGETIFRNIWDDGCVAEYLNLSYVEYREIVERHGGHLELIDIWNQNDLIFLNEADAARTIADLEPYLIMRKLTE